MPLPLRLFLLVCAGLTGCTPRIDPSGWTASTPLAEVLRVLSHSGAQPPGFAPDPDQVLRGHELVFTGRASAPDGSARSPLSSYFVCVDCHLTAREQPDQAHPVDDAARLAWLERDHLLLLPGNTLAGVTDRAAFFQGDWASRPGWEPAAGVRADLRRAVRFCATRVARGRPLEDWEESAILAYLTSLQWRLGDLDLTANEVSTLKTAALDPARHSALVGQLQTRYRLALPGTFGKVPTDPAGGFGLPSAPNPQNGARVWRLSCLHCHGPDGASATHFKDRPKDIAELARRFTAPGPENLYQILRHGTPSHPDRGSAVMPGFTRERLSDAMIEDLRFWMEQQGTSPPPP